MNHLEKAKGRLQNLRRFTNPLCTEYWLKELHEALAEIGYTLKDIGTSEAELRKLERTGYRKAAFYKLRLLRTFENPLIFEYTLADMFQHLRAGRIPMREIGVTHKELKKLRRESARQAALHYLKQYQTHRRPGSLEYLLKILREKKISPKTIGTNWAALDHHNRCLPAA